MLHPFLLINLNAFTLHMVNNLPFYSQLEAIIRISESLAKMRLAAFATETDVEEALRLFHVSTLEAAMSGSLEGAEGFTTQEEHELILRLEKQLKKRFVIGSQVSEYAIIQDFTRQVCNIPVFQYFSSYHQNNLF